MSRDGRGLLAALLVAAPVALGVTYSLAMGVGLSGPQTHARAPLLEVLSESAVWRGTLWSLWVAAASTMLATAAAIPVAVVLRGRGWVDRVGRAAAVLPLPVPHLVAALLGVLILAQSGLLARWALGMGVIDSADRLPVMVYDRWGVGMILVLAWKEMAFLALVAWSVLAERGEGLEEAGRTLGAGSWATFRLVTLPVLWRGMLPAVVAVFTFVLGSYEVAALLAPSDPMPLPVLTMERYTDGGAAGRVEAHVLALLGIALAALAVAAHELTRARWEALES